MSDNQIRCWCGAVGSIDELFCFDVIDGRCGGTGELTCYCGGSQCVCHNHGTTECDGCEDCIDDSDPYDDGWDYNDLP